MPDRRGLTMLYRILSPRERRKMAVLAVVILVMGVLELVGVVSILPFIQLVADPGIVERNATLSALVEPLNLAGERQLLILVGGVVIALLLLTNAFSVFKTWLQFHYSWGIANHVSVRLLHAYLTRPYAYFLNRNTSEFTAYIIGEATLLITGVLVPLIELVSRVFVSLVIFGLLLYVEPVIALSMFGTLGLAYGLIYLTQRGYLRRVGRKRMVLSIGRYNALKEMFAGIKTVQVFGRQRFFADRYAAASTEFCGIQPKYNLLTTYPRYLLEVISFGTIIGITIYLYLKEGDISGVVPTLSLYAVAGYRLLPALQNAFAALGKFTHNRPIIDKIHDGLFGAYGEQPLPPHQLQPLPLRNPLALNNVSFTYAEADQPILSGVDLTIRRGETVAFVGSTGSGKTTTVDLLVGLLRPTRGTVTIDGAPLTPDNLADWRASVAYVPQEVFLFDDTIARNISLREELSPADQERLREAARLADILDFITEELPAGLDTTVGERGVRLSGGQRQRLGLARAFFHQPSVLVLDEATSALDNITERGIIESLAALPETMTVILIAHRLSTVRHADRIFLMEAGRVAATGSYAELLQKSATFQEMARTN